MRKLITEHRKFFVEKKSDKDLRKGVLAIVTGTLGATETSNRTYKKDALTKGITDKAFQQKIKERRVFGILDHPDAEDNAGTRVKEISHLITEMKMEGSDVKGSFEVLDTPSGRILKTLLDAETGIGWSLRGYGDTITEDGGEVVTDYECETADIVCDPAVARTCVEREVVLAEARKSQSPFAKKMLEDTIESMTSVVEDKILKKRRIKSLLNMVESSKKSEDCVMTIKEKLEELRKKAEELKAAEEEVLKDKDKGTVEEKDKKDKKEEVVDEEAVKEDLRKRIEFMKAEIASLAEEEKKEEPKEEKKEEPKGKEEVEDEKEKKEEEDKKAKAAELVKERIRQAVLRRREEAEKAQKEKEELYEYKIEVLSSNVLAPEAREMIKEAETKKAIDSILSITKTARFRKERITRDKVEGLDVDETKVEESKKYDPYTQELVRQLYGRRRPKE